MVSWIELVILQLALCVSFLLHERNHEIVHGGRMWLLWVLVPIALLSVDVEAGLGLPARLVFLLRLHGDKVFVHERERLGKVLLRVGVEVSTVILDELSQLLLLELPDVLPLATVGEHLDIFRDVDTGLERSACTQLPNRLPVRVHEVLFRLHRAGPDALFESRVLANCLRVSLGRWNLFLLRLLVSLSCDRYEPRTCGEVSLRLAEL